MRKSILLAALFAIVLKAESYAQNHVFTSRIFEVEAVDAWGDKDGSVNFGVRCEGYFRNCATDGDEATLKFFGNTKDDYMFVVLREYKTLTSDMVTCFKLINDKGENLFNASVFVERKTNRNGYIDYGDLIAFLRKSEWVKVQLMGEASTNAYFKIDNPKEFAKLIERYSGLPQKEIDKKVDDVYWYSKNWNDF